jgi:argininosuccinate lyase
VPEYAPELIEGAFAIEVADAELLHHPLDLADIAHVLVLRQRGVGPADATARLLGALLAAHATPVAQFDYNPAHGEIYNCRENWLAARIGNDAGWLHAGRPRREAVRIALRLRLRRDALALLEATAALVVAIGEQAEAHAETYLAEQTYLQHAQPSTFGHFLLSTAYPALRDLARLEDAYAWLNRSPGGAGGVNGSALTGDRETVAELLAFDGVIEHTRDAMWQIDGLIHVLATAASLVSTQSKLAEDLEIWSSSEFDFVDLADEFTRASILMPQKRNPYSLSIVRGASGILIGRLTGFLAVAKSPSARSDNLIFAYGEVPRALDLSIRVTRLMSGVVRTLQVNRQRMQDTLDAGYTQATDLAEFIVQACDVDYRSAYVVVGKAVREASRRGLPGRQITGGLLDELAEAETGHPWGLAELDLSDVLDPWSVVTTRTATGGAAPAAVAEMVEHCRADTAALSARVAKRRAAASRATTVLLAKAQAVLDGTDLSETEEV